MASVWIARQRGKHGFEKLVALKTILPQFASDLRFQQMFLDEARIASRIEHFNVARILDLGEEHDVLYLAMEYVDGVDGYRLLRRLKQEGRLLAPGIAVHVTREVLRALSSVHTAKDSQGRALGIIHRDVTPSNVYLSGDGRVKLGDFGIARSSSRATIRTGLGFLGRFGDNTFDEFWPDVKQKLFHRRAEQARN